VLGVVVLVATASPLAAQELEPGAYWPLPAGLNIITVASGVDWGDVTFDPALPIDDARATLVPSAVAFTRAFDLAGRSANVGVVAPFIAGTLTGFYLGEYTEVDRVGQGDPRVSQAFGRWVAEIGATFSKVLKPRHSIRASVSRGAYTTIGADFAAVGLAYNYAWATP
jgi:hypothetical protein